MRGLACILMFQTHCYDAWLGGDARKGTFLKGSQLLGTLPAPLFLFLAGVSFALVTDKLIRKNLSPGEITRSMFRRGAEILAFGLLFRLQEFIIAWGWAPKSDLLRVDVLNIIGLSMMLMALLCGVTLATSQNTSEDADHRGRAALQGSVGPVETTRALAPVGGMPRTALISAAIGAASLIALLTPPLYTTWRPTWLPWWLESYVDGCHNLGAPQPWLFSLFPWAAFAFAGLAAGFILFSDQARNQTTKALTAFAAVGILAIVAAFLFDHSRFHLYSTYDYWHTSPNFLMARVGILLVIAFLTYAWCRWGWARRGFSPLIQLGQTGSGILFASLSTDETVPARLDWVDSTGYATTLHKEGVTAKTVEHLLATFHAYGITNLLVKMQGEIPIMDGSAVEFCKLIEGAGVVEQGGTVEEIVINRRIVVGRDDGESIAIEPADCFGIAYTLLYPHPVGLQEYTYIHHGPRSFREEIAPARTFGFVRDMKQLAAMGLASGGRLDNCILIDDEKVVNTSLRFPDEFARHKILDIMGDTYLFGRPIRGMISARMTGHSDNIALMRAIKRSLGLT